MKYFDAHVAAHATVLLSDTSMLSGAIFFDAAAAEMSRKFRQIKPKNFWSHAENLKHIVSAHDSRFPASQPAVVTLALSDDDLMHRLRAPAADWWPLMNSLRERRIVLHLPLPAGSRAVVGVRKLARKFEQTKFLIDPFIHGPQDGWQAQVGLAEAENIWLTTLGMLPVENGLWKNSTSIDEAMYHLVGEVGAGKLLLATGWTLDDERRREDSPANPQNWLAQIRILDEDQRKIVLCDNAADLFGFSAAQAE